MTLPQLFVEVLSNERDGEGLFLLTADFTYGDVTVPSGYVTDFASIPRPFRWLFCISGKSAKAAVLHDYLMSRDEVAKATATFSAVLRDSGVSDIGRAMMVAAVFVFTFPSRFFGSADPPRLQLRWREDPRAEGQAGRVQAQSGLRPRAVRAEGEGAAEMSVATREPGGDDK